MKILPLFYYPSTCLWVDDDKSLLGSMSTFFGNKKRIRFLNSGSECINFLKNYKSPLNRHRLLEVNSEDEYYGLSQRLPMDVDLSKLNSLIEDQTKYDEVTVMILDYNMPKMNGFELAAHLQEHSIPKILLTGNNNDHN